MLPAAVGKKIPWTLSCSAAPIKALYMLEYEQQFSSFAQSYYISWKAHAVDHDSIACQLNFCSLAGNSLLRESAYGPLHNWM